MGDPNCYNNAFLDNCYVCPNGNSTGVNGENLSCVVNSSRRKRINRQTRTSASMGLFKKRALVVSKQVGQCANPKKILEAGGPGDLTASIQKSNVPKAVGRAACYNMGHLRNRTAYRNNLGVDRKHGSYQRYLARRVGGVLRKENTITNYYTGSQYPKAYLGQSRKRARGGISQVVTACNNKGMTSGNRNLRATCLPDEQNEPCCTNRIPSSFQTNTNCYLSPSAQRTCVAGKCKCCSN